MAMVAWNTFVQSTQAFYDNLSGGLQPSPLTKGYFGTSLSFMLAMDLGYLAFVFIGCLVMKQVEKPFELKLFKMFHNLFLFGLSAYMCIECIRQALLAKYSLFGNAMSDGTDPHGQGMANVIWVFYLSKSYEFFDTVIMILTKKFEQVSFLHVYHHCTIFAIWWAIATYAPGGDAYFSTILNSFVHVVMYAYYFFSGLKFTFLNPIKPFITSMQMTQFMCMLVQSLYDYTYPPKYPRFLIILLGVYMLTLLALFGNFFYQTYVAGKKRSKKTN